MLLCYLYGSVLSAGVVFALIPTAHASFREDLMKSFGNLLNGSGNASSETTKTSVTALTQSEMSQGIKEAMFKGV